MRRVKKMIYCMELKFHLVCSCMAQRKYHSTHMVEGFHTELE